GGAAGPRSALLLFLDLALESRARGGDLAGGLLLVLALHAFLEAAHRATQVGADVAQLLRPEDEEHDDEHDEPVPDAEGTHGNAPSRRPLFRRDHAREAIGAADDVDVQMIHV